MGELQSFDTIGNGYYALTSHIFPRGWHNVTLVTSAFHMPRSKAIFDWILSLAERATGTRYTLQCVTVSDEVRVSVLFRLMACQSTQLAVLRHTHLPACAPAISSGLFAW
jgi:hypothetical protein